MDLMLLSLSIKVSSSVCLAVSLSAFIFMHLHKGQVARQVILGHRDSVATGLSSDKSMTDEPTFAARRTPEILGQLRIANYAEHKTGLTDDELMKCQPNPE